MRANAISMTLLEKEVSHAFPMPPMADVIGGR